MTSMRRRYVASTSLRRHVPAGNLAPPWPPQYSKPWPPQYSKPSYTYVVCWIIFLHGIEIKRFSFFQNQICTQEFSVLYVRPYSYYPSFLSFFRFIFRPIHIVPKTHFYAYRLFKSKVFFFTNKRRLDLTQIPQCCKLHVHSQSAHDRLAKN